MLGGPLLAILETVWEDALSSIDAPQLPGRMTYPVCDKLWRLAVPALEGGMLALLRVACEERIQLHLLNFA